MIPKTVRCRWLRPRAKEREGVPIVRNIGLARGVWGESEVGGPIPRDRFDAIAEIILWARRARDGLEAPVREDAE